MNSPFQDLTELLTFIVIYWQRKTKKIGQFIEKAKNFLVEGLMHRRGRLQKHFWHGAMIVLTIIAVLTSGIFGGTAIVSSAFPGTSSKDPRQIQTFDPLANGVELQSLIDFHTDISQKPRSEVIDYEVKGGETLSEIAEKFSISTDTVRWANSLTSDTLKPGQTLKILPVSGVAHSVKSGDTLESVAKKYSVDQQSIVDFPFNDIPDDFTLRVGQVLIVPEGVPPETKIPVKPRIQPQYIAAGSNANSPTFSAPAGGSFIWPTTTVGISQYFAWYHPGLDLPNPSAPTVVASDGGTVIVAGWPDNYGYGNRIVLDHGNGYQTLYAHLSNIYVTPGQQVSRGQGIGQMGSTGRSTGTHLHFEIHFKGVAINPLAILK